MATVNKRIENSYNAYLKYRGQWAQKGYGLDRQLTLEEYTFAHKSASHIGWNHIAREIAAQDRTFTRSEGAAILRRIKNATKYEKVDEELLRNILKRYKRSKDIYGLQLTDSEAMAMEQRRRDALAARGKEAKYIIQANARAKLFNELRDAGLSYKEAEKVLYGD